MDSSTFQNVRMSVDICLASQFGTKSHYRTRLCLPPGSQGWPIVGNFFQLEKSMPHHTLYALSLQYGPLMTLGLGMRTTVVVSSPAMAKVFKTYDNILAGRSVIEINKTLSHDKSSLIWADCGPYWHHLRLISTVELFSPKRLEALPSP
ncbi:hypothetical protein SUGI_0445340 [Cryptomeria japonica]|nr:hypothetical protein SUGI_0445340 [Cryptomeria japonica]